jgi:hypothetical protein
MLDRHSAKYIQSIADIFPPEGIWPVAGTLEGFGESNR